MSGTTPKAPAWGSASKPPSSLYKAAAALPSKPAASSSAGGRTANRNASGGRSSSGRGANGSNNPRKGGGGGGGGGRGGTNASGGRGGGRGKNSNNNNNNNQGGGGRGRGNSGRGRGNNNNNNSGGRGSNPNNNARRESYNNKSSPQHQQDSQQQQQQQQQQDNVPRTPWEEIVLLHSTGMGNGEAEKSVVRCSVTSLMTCRLDYLDAPSEPSDQTGDSDMVWTPISRCVWTSDADRRRTIQADMNVLWNYKPLEIDHEKRWKKPVDEEGEALRRAVGILNKLSWTTLEKLTLSFLEAIGLANLLQQAATTDNNSTNNNNSTSPSNKDSTSPAAVSLDKKLVEDSMALILDKAMSEPHFAELYAHFSAKLFSVHKTFRRSLLGLCEAQFKNTDNANTTSNSNDGGDSSTPNSEEGKEDAATVEAKTDEADKEEPTMDAATAEYNAALAKKKYLGLVQFIGELYKLSVIKPKIVVFCLQELFVKADEEKLECFAKLMTTIGEKLDKEDSIREDLAHVWDDVYSMAGRPTQNTTNGPKAPSNRIKFLLQDLSDLRQGGWVESQRRQESKAKTIAQIHEEVALEEKQQKQQQQKPNKTRMIRSQSAGTSLNSRSSITSTSGSGSTSTLDVDADGFQKVQSLKPPKKTGLRRVQSDVATSVKSNAPTSSLERALAATVTGAPSNTTTPSPPITASSVNGQDDTDNKASNTASNKEDGATKQYLSPDECEKKMENILKEYFVGGDTADAVLSVDELVGASSSTNTTDTDVVARGEAVVRAGILLVLERKHDDVSKFLTVLKHCLVPESRPPIVPWSCLALGLCLPLELLRDVEIDAPLAPKHLAQIVVEWMRLPPGNDASPTTTTTTTGGLDLAQLLLQQAPDYFRSDGRPAQFAKQVLQSYYHEKTSADISDDHVQLVSQLLSEDERWEHSNVREWILSS